MRSATYIFFTLIASLAARADMVPGKVRYLMGAQMKVTLAEGVFEAADHAKLFTTEKTGTGERGLVLEINGRRKFFNVSDIEQDECGSLRMKASSVVVNRCGPRERCMGVARIMRVELLDHSKRICEDVKPHLWQVRVTDQLQGTRNELGQLRMVGNPEPMMNTMDERDFE